MVAGDGSDLLNPGTVTGANVMSSSSGNTESALNTLQSGDNAPITTHSSSDKADLLINSTPSANAAGSTSDDLKVFYLNTAHGEATLVESSGHFMMINAGDAKDSGGIIDYLNKTGVTSLDYVIATDLNQTAIGGMSSLMGAYPVSVFNVPSTSFSSPSYDGIKGIVKDKQIGFQQVAPGDSLPFGAATIQFLNTTTSPDNPDGNAMSVLVSTGEVTFLFTGNQKLSPSPATFWAVPGQGNADSLATIDTTSSQVLVISTGSGAPDQQALDSLKKQNVTPLLTSADGTIVVSTDGSQYHVTTGSGKIFEKPIPTPIPTPEETVNNSPISGDIHPSDLVSNRSVI